MPKFRFTIHADKWPSQYEVEASNWPTAAARAVKLWRKGDGKGSRTTELSIKGIKVNIVPNL